jgi:hypothetical protein
MMDTPFGTEVRHTYGHESPFSLDCMWTMTSYLTSFSLRFIYSMGLEPLSGLNAMTSVQL